jgi:endonuclease/exonuclease/phosphatase family metal-dependent hydrolase
MRRKDDTVEPAPQWEVKELVRVMSFNVLQTHTADEESAYFADLWRQRADLNVRVIKRYRPDLIGFQELDNGHWAVYETQLAEYAFQQAPAGGRLSNAIGWKPERFDLVGSGVLPLCPTPEPADAAWVRLRCCQSGHELLCLNTQLNDESEPARVESVRLILAGLDQLQPARPLPVLLIGDFNCNAWSPIYQRLLAEGFADTYRAAGLPDTVEASTFHGLRGRAYFALEWGDQLHWRVDWILARDGGARLITTAAAIARDAEPPLYPSDHYPVLADLRLQA